MKLTNLFRVALFIISLLGCHASFSQTCTIPSIYLTSPSPNGATFGYNCNSVPCQDTLYIEYGPNGFIPGTDSSPGPLGTVAQVPTWPNQYTISGLPASTLYQCYIRQDCGTSWSGNSAPLGFSTPPDCNAAPIINCNNIYPVMADSGTGAWNTYCQPGITISLGREQVFSYTAAHSGTHQLFIKNYTYTGNQWLFYYKEASASCNDTGWNCIGTGLSSNTTLRSFGPLTYGVTYLIRADSYTDIDIDSTQIKIECPQCPVTGTANVAALSPYTARVSWTGFNNGYGEIGPYNYIPGSMSSPGIGGYGATGTTANPAVINTTLPNTVYDIYARPLCTWPGGLNISAGYYMSPDCPFVNYPGLGTQFDVYGNGPGFNWTYDGSPGCFIPWGAGIEKIVQFDPPVTGYFDVHYRYYGPMLIESAFKIHDEDCHPNTFSCLNPYFLNTSSGITAKYLLYLDKDTIYDFFMDTEDTTIWSILPSAYLKIQCPIPDTVHVNYISNTSFELTWFSYWDSVLIEYGPQSFIPGDDITPGNGGTVILVSGTNSYTISGLAPNSTYDVYIRSICGGSYGPNSIKKKVFLNNTCMAAPIVNCGGPIGTYWATLYPGVWNNYNCIPQETYPGTEKFFQFTAQDSGMYSLYISQQGWTCLNTGIFYREVTTGCEETGWTCIGNNTCPPELFIFGPLDAGKTYYLMFDSPTYQSGGLTRGIDLYCPAPCLLPFSLNTSLITDTSANFTAFFMDTPGIIYAEYGPAGFTPGSDSLPGIGGVVFSNVSASDTLFNLNQATTYDLYVRQHCASGTGFSENKKTTFTTLATNCALGPSGITSYYGDTVCAGGYTYLSAQGIIASMQYGAPEVYWYVDSCFSNPIDTTNNLIVYPTLTTTYYCIAHDSCGYTSCVSKTINVIASLPVTITASDTTFCPGDSVVADAGSGFNSYLWNNGATSQTITIHQPGNYWVTVTSANGCTDRDTISVFYIPTTTPIISGDSIICPTDTTSLDAGSGFANYLWSTGSTTQTILVSDAGTYTVAVSNANGCITSDSIVVLETIPVPVVISAGGPIDICQGDSVLLSATAGLVSYNWYRNNMLLTGANSSQYYAHSTGNYKCSIIDSNGCTSISNNIRVRIVCIPIGPNEEKVTTVDPADPLLVEVYPNPSLNGFSFNIFCDQEEVVSIDVFEQSGRKVSVSVIQNSVSEYFINKLNPGFYYAEIRCANRKSVVKIIQL